MGDCSGRHLGSQLVRMPWQAVAVLASTNMFLPSVPVALADVCLD